ncbi:MAG: hypothetical protein HUJ54_15200, partial [Erysipelotrichaceae bacterium]|nr:hypothetical protein [Erysipelotrichaceae bacterium]
KKQRIHYPAAADNQTREMQRFNEFIRSMGPDDHVHGFKKKGEDSQNAYYVWKDADWEKVSSFLTDMAEISPSPFFKVAVRLCDWIGKNHETHPELNLWDVILVGNDNGTRLVQTPAGPLYPVVRTVKNRDENVLDLGALLSSKDLFLDIDIDKNPGAEELIKNFKNGITAVTDLRKKTDVAKKPVLLLYVIDKDSEPRRNSDRQALKTASDLIGISFLIPETDSQKHRDGYWQIPARLISDMDDLPDVENQDED